MKRYKFLYTIFVFFSLISISQYCEGQNKRMLSSPVYLGAVLLEQPDSAYMAQLCRNYHFTQLESEDGFEVYTDGDNTKIRFKMVKQKGHNIPFIEMSVREKGSVIKQALVQQGFVRSGDEYIKGSTHSNTYSVCSYKPGRIARLKFTKVLTI